MPLQRTPPAHLKPPAQSSSSLAASSSDSSLINTPTRGGRVTVEVPPSPFGTRKSALPRTPPDGKRPAAEQETPRSAKRQRLSPPGAADAETSTTPTGPAPGSATKGRRRSSRPIPVQSADYEAEDSQQAGRIEAEQEGLVAEVASPPRQGSQNPETIPESRTAPEPTALAAPEDYGRHYSSLLKVLEIAVLKGANKWTADDFRSFFPIRAKDNHKAFEDVWAASAQTMRDTIVSHAHALLEDYKAGPLLKLFNEVLEEAKAARDAGEGGGWAPGGKPDISPAALTAASTLPGFDDIYARLFQEHTELYNDSNALYAGIHSKHAELAALEAEIKDAAGELDGTLEALDGFPDDDMQQWTWNVVRGLENKRAPDRQEAQ